MAVRSEYRRALSRARAARRERSSASSRISWRKWSSDGLAEGEHADDAVAGDQRQDDRLAADRGGRGERGADAGGDRWRSPRPRLAQGGAQGGRVGGLGGRGPDAGAGGGHRVRRVDLGEQGLEAVDAVLVLVQDVGEVRVRGLVGDRVDGAPGGEGGDRHLGHQGQGLVAVEGAGEQVGGLDEEGERAAAQPFQFGEAGAIRRPARCGRRRTGGAGPPRWSSGPAASAATPREPVSRPSTLSGTVTTERMPVPSSSGTAPGTAVRSSWTAGIRAEP